MSVGKLMLGDLVEFILLNRRGKAFVKWTRQEITMALLEALESGTLLYSISPRGYINGVVHGSKHDGHTLHIHNILTIEDGVFRTFVKRFNELYPGWKLEARRHDRIKEYNTPRLITKMTTTTKGTL